MEFKGKLPEITLKYKSGDVNRLKIKNSKSAFNVLKKLYDSDTINYCETVIVLFLNKANNTISWIKLNQGGMTGTIIDTRMLFSAALNCGATSFILSHNHPSGNVKPSESDKKITKKIKEAGIIMDIEMIDHIIVSNKVFFSFADNGLI